MIKSNKFISNFSLFATVLIFIMTVSMGLAFYFIDKSNPVAWLIGTLFIGLGVAFFKSLSNMNTLLILGMNKESEKLYNTMNKDVVITSSPDYWTKNVAYNSEKNESIILCYNKLPNSPKDNALLIGGQLIKSGEYDYVFSDDSMFPGKTLKEVREMAELPYKSDPNMIENFTMLNPSDPDYKKFYHRHEDVVYTMSGKVSTTDDSAGNVDTNHQHTFYSRPQGHSHPSTVYGNMPIENPIFNKYEETFENLTNWISPYLLPDGRYAIEINITVLNKMRNKCELAKNFIWSNANLLCIKPVE